MAATSARRVAPIEPGDAMGQRFQQRQAANLGRPGEEVGLDDALQAGRAAELPADQQVGRAGCRHPPDVDAERGLDDHADDGGQVGVPDEQIVHLLRRAGDLAQRGAQEVVPELALDLDRLVAGAGLVEGL